MKIPFLEETLVVQFFATSMPLLEGSALKNLSKKVRLYYSPSLFQMGHNYSFLEDIHLPHYPVIFPTSPNIYFLCTEVE